MFLRTFYSRESSRFYQKSKEKVCFSLDCVNPIYFLLSAKRDACDIAVEVDLRVVDHPARHVFAHFGRDGQGNRRGIHVGRKAMNAKKRGGVRHASHFEDSISYDFFSFSSSAMKALGPPFMYPISPTFLPSPSRTMIVG